jgi:uncharacterized protein (TIGR02118 family)
MEKKFMRSFAALAAILFAVACTKPATPAADTTVAQTAAAPVAPAAETPAAPGWVVTVLYNHPKDTAAFEKYYAEKHLPLFQSKAKEIGITKGILVKFTSNADGSKPAHYREAELWFASQEALKAGMATDGFKAVAGDLKNFSTGGTIVMVGQETR